MAENQSPRHPLQAQKSAEELETIVREACMHPGSYEESYTDAVLDELVSRAKKEGSAPTEDELTRQWNIIKTRASRIRDTETVQKIRAWAKKGTASQSRTRHSLLRASAAAAVLAFCLLAIPVAQGQIPIYEILVRWTDERLTFLPQGIPPAVIAPPETLSQNCSDGLAKLREELQELNVYEKIIPGWLPEGYEFVDSESQVMDTSAYIGSTFVRGEELLTLVYHIRMTDHLNIVEKDDGEVKEYTVSGITHYIASNRNRLQCVWQNGSVSCILSGDISEEELYRIIDSMYG